VATAEMVRDFQGHGSDVRSVAVSADGKLLATHAGVGATTGSTNEKQTRVWDIESGKLLVQFAASAGVAFAPDDNLLAHGATDATLRIKDAVTGRDVRTFAGPPGQNPLAFSPDGRTLLTLGTDKKARVWEAATGQLRRTYESSAGGYLTAAFARGGRLLVLGDSDRSATVVDATTGAAVKKLAGHDGTVGTLAVSADGTRLLSGGTDTTALVWDAGSFVKDYRGKGAKPSPGVLENLWSDLDGQDAEKAFLAVWALADAPAQSLELFRERLVKDKAAAAPAGDVSKLLLQLDDDEFSVREKATQELTRLAKVHEKVLREALVRTTSAEVKRRLEDVLANLGPSAAPVQAMRPARAVEVLELIGTPDASKLLEELAKGSAEAPLTREAKAALGRLKRRP
jgi:hypothetical protein